MRSVRTTMRPHEQVQVTDAEYTDLKRQGLVLEELDQPATPAPVLPAAAPAVNRSGQAEPVSAPPRRKTTDKKTASGESGADTKED